MNKIIPTLEFSNISSWLEWVIWVKSVLRWYYSWVFYGTIDEVKVCWGIQMFKITGRRLYYWKVVKWISINALAEYWIDVKWWIKIENPTTFYCYDINQILPCTKEAINIFDKIKLDFNN